MAGGVCGQAVEVRSNLDNMLLAICKGTCPQCEGQDEWLYFVDGKERCGSCVDKQFLLNPESVKEV